MLRASLVTLLHQVERDCTTEDTLLAIIRWRVLRASPRYVLYADEVCHAILHQLVEVHRRGDRVVRRAVLQRPLVARARAESLALLRPPPSLRTACADTDRRRRLPLRITESSLELAIAAVCGEIKLSRSHRVTSSLEIASSKAK